MLLDNSLIIAYSTYNYKLRDNFINSLLKLNFNKDNINLFIDNIINKDDEVECNTNIWIKIKIKKLKNLIDILKININNINYKYFISSDCDINFLTDNINEWKNLEYYIDKSNIDIFFMSENNSLDLNGNNVLNTGFFIIKNNENLIDIIIYLNDVLNLMLEYPLNRNISGDKDIINQLKSHVNYGIIPNEYVIWSTNIFDANKSLIHHPVCCSNVNEKINQIKYINDILKKSYKIVIAKYKENIDWINYLDKSNVIVYDKSETPYPNSINIPNIGRDPETFLFYLIENYNNLPDYVFFLQGDPFAHFNDKSINPFNLKFRLYDLLTKQIKFSGLYNEVTYENPNLFNHSMKWKNYFSFLFKNECPNSISFIAGCQYIVSKNNILKRPLTFYKHNKFSSSTRRRK
jgi:hypothetical protein